MTPDVKVTGFVNSLIVLKAGGRGPDGLESGPAGRLTWVPFFISMVTVS
jgi:hypothetical protein